MDSCSKNQKKLCGNRECDICLERSFASYQNKTIKGKFKIECWNNEINGTTKPINVSKGSNKKFSFKCDICYHNFNTSLNNVTQNKWCPYCSKSCKKLCDSKECDICLERSFASYPDKTINGKFKIECWNNEKNGTTKPRDIIKQTHTKYWFRCDICFHDFENSPHTIIGQSCWCPYCSHQKLCDNDCEFCFNNSFESCDNLTPNGKLKKDCWDNEKNNRVKPRDIFKNSGKKYWFQCDTCPHSFNIALNKDSWCCYCSHQKLCDNDCEFCFNNSFASCNNLTPNGKLKKDCWDNEKNDRVKPRDIFKYTNNKYWFTCDRCNKSIDISITNLSRLNNWCSYCKNKTEQIFLTWFEKIYELEIKHQFKFTWLKKHPFDFVIEEYKLIIEIDGIQHFEQVSNWKSPEENFKNDEHKIKNAFKNGYSIIRIFQEDIYNNKNEWDIQIKKAIKLYEAPKQIFIGSDSLYKKYKSIKI